MSASVSVCINCTLTLRPHHHPLLLTYVSYSGKLSQEKTFTNGWKKKQQQIFTEKTFADSSLVLTKDTMALNFAEETFANSHKTSKFMKVLPLESFPLHGSTGGEVWEEGHSTHELVGKVTQPSCSHKRLTLWSLPSHLRARQAGWWR